jgi:hypothetical protein
MKILRRLAIRQDAVELPKLTLYSPLNPSVLVGKAGLQVVYRGCNYRLRSSGYRFFQGSWKSDVTDNQNYICNLSFDLKLQNVNFLEDRHLRVREEAMDGIQDLKLFRWLGGLYATGSGCNSADYLRGTAPSRRFSIMMFQVMGQRLEFVATLRSFALEEKNWMPWVRDKDLYFLHRPSPFKLLKYDPDSKDVREVKMDPAPLFEDGTSGSSCILPFGEDFIGMTHRKDGTGPSTVYRHRLFVMTRQSVVTRVSEPFSFEGAAVEYGSGLAFKDGAAYLGYGAFDERAVILRFQQEDLLRSLDWQATGPNGRADPDSGHPQQGLQRRP